MKFRDRYEGMNGTGLAVKAWMSHALRGKLAGWYLRYAKSRLKVRRLGPQKNANVSLSGGLRSPDLQLTADGHYYGSFLICGKFNRSLLHIFVSVNQSTY